MKIKNIAEKFVTVAPVIHLGIGCYLGLKGVHDTTKMFKLAQKANDRMIELVEKAQKNELTDTEQKEYNELKYVFLSSLGVGLWGGIRTLAGIGFMHAGLTELCSNVNDQHHNEINDKLDTILQVQGIGFHNNLRTASDVIALCKKNGITEEDLKSCFETWKNEDPDAKESDAE